MPVWEKEGDFKEMMSLLVALLKGNKLWMKRKQTSKGDIVLQKTELDCFAQLQVKLLVCFCEIWKQVCLICVGNEFVAWDCITVGRAEEFGGPISTYISGIILSKLFHLSVPVISKEG